MKRSLTYFLFLFAFLTAFYACKEESVAPFDTAAQAAADDALIKEYMAKDSTIKDPVRTSSGLYYVKRNAGSGPQIKAGDVVKVHYIGKFLNGQVFESSYSTNSPIIVQGVGKGRVIKGWDEGLQLMQEGETARLYIPSGLAYGPRGSGQSIPANAPLVFEMTVLDVNP